MNRLAARTAIVLSLFAIVFIALGVASYTQKSATWDEPQHVTAGYIALTRHDYRTDPEHPPFLRMWAALPLLAFRDIKLDTTVIDRVTPSDWTGLMQFYFCHHFMYKGNDADRLLYAARIMIVLLGVLLGVILFFWTNEWLGFWPAIVTLAFFTIEPNISAHSSLVTTDFGLTCFFFGTLYFAWRTCRRPRLANIAGLTVFFVLANISKFSALMLGPIVAVLLGIAVVRLRTLKLKAAIGIIVVLALTTWLAIWAVYGFRYTPSASNTWLFQFENDALVQQRTPRLAGIVSWIDAHHLLPNAYTEGFLIGQSKAQLRGAFLAGRHSAEGWWYYFPVAFLIKTPVALIILLVGGLVVYVKRWRQLGLENEAFVLLPIVLYLGSAMLARLNIGLRHLLPIYPFVLLLAAAAVKELIDAKSKSGWIVLGVLVAFWLFEFGRVYPNNLAFFNQAVGGPRNGYKYLADSNLDWGQDLKPLKKWMERNGAAHINLAYFGTADPAYYHIDCTYLPGTDFVGAQSIKPPQLPGYVAVSATILDGVYLDELGRAFYKPLRDAEPVADIGYSIHVYRVERPWW
jgi:Dolichyl-phosphate-mannose-protein mannosyltransferase